MRWLRPLEEAAEEISDDGMGRSGRGEELLRLSLVLLVTVETQQNGCMIRRRGQGWLGRCIGGWFRRRRFASEVGG